MLTAGGLKYSIKEKKLYLVILTTHTLSFTMILGYTNWEKMNFSLLQCYREKKQDHVTGWCQDFDFDALVQVSVH